MTADDIMLRKKEKPIDGKAAAEGLVKRAPKLPRFLPYISVWKHRGKPGIEIGVRGTF